MANKKDLLKKVYAKLLAVGFGEGSLEETDQYIIKDVMGYGTAVDEKIMTLEGFKDLINEQRIQAGNFDDFSFTSNPVIMRILDNGKTALVVDEIELHTKIKNESNTLFLRMTTVFEYRDGAWLIVHWHGSKPEHISGGEDPWHVDEWRRKNEELQRLVEDKTADLIDINRELEIESSLERVRAVAMSMNKPDDLLNVSKIQYKEFKKLGFKDLRNSLIAIFHDDQNYFLDHDYSDETGGSINKVIYNSHPVIDNLIAESRKANDVFVEFVIDDEQLDEWKEFRKDHGEINDPRLDNINSLFYYNYSIGNGAVGISTFKPISQEQLKILKRFRNVFDLAYRRYSDIAVAEAQAREAKIETALERVRSAAMAMHDSQELQNVVSVVFKQLQALNFGLDGAAFIATNVKEFKGFDFWMEDKITNPSRFRLPYYNAPSINDLFNARQKKKDFVSKIYGKEKNIWFEYAFENTDLRIVPEDRKKWILAQKYLTQAFAIQKNSMIGFHAHHSKTLSNDEINILKRFSKVFEQGFVRFLDLQKSEAQAREAQIEASLERVRSRTMGMQKSDELPEVANHMFKEIKSLGIPVWSTAFNIFSHGKESVICNVSSEGQLQPAFILPLTEEKSFKEWYRALNNNESFFVQELGGKDLKQHYEYLFTLPGVKDATQPLEDENISLPEYQINHICSFKNGFLLFITYEKVPDVHQIFHRFTTVFKQTYTRFLDLQKAEAQTREAKIEAALERVRSLALGMRKSEEVGEVTDELFKELTNLKIDVSGCSIAVIDEDNDKMELWRARSNFAVKPFDSTSFTTSMDLFKKNMPETFRTFFKALEKRGDCLIDELSGKKRLQFIDLLAEQYSYSSEEKSRLLKNTPEIIHAHYVFFKLGYLGILSQKKLADEELSIAGRFMEVFDFAYTRFLDIKNAEAQAREAQIEAALERVRSRTMGMQKSEELKEVIQVVYEQFVQLKINIEHTGFIVDYKTNEDMHIWLADQNGAPSEITIPYFDSPHWNSFIEAKKEGIDLFINTHNFEEKNRFYEKLFDFIPELTDEAKKFYFSCPGLAISTVLMDNVGLYMENFSGVPYTDEENTILKRFGKVFQQTYTRFLDLQKAEAQARESQIEAALEKVRSRSLAMQKANELGEVVKVIVERLQDLGVVLDANGVVLCTYFKDSKDVMHWIASPDFSFVGSYLLPYFDHPIFNHAWNSKESGDEYFSKAFPVDEKNSFFEYAFEHSDYKHFPDNFKEWIFQNDQHILSFAWQENSAILIPSHTGAVPTEEQVAILKRFAKVFEQSYIRFLDLQKAEAQAREAQIEASLERVRASAMSMHDSEDLSSTVDIFFKEIKALGIIPIRCGIGQIDEATCTTNLTTTTSSQLGRSFDVIGKVKQTGHLVLDGIFENWKLQKEYHPILTGDDIKDYYSIMNKQINYPEYREDLTQYGNIFYFKEGFVFAWTESKLSDEELKIFRRFTSVLSLTYRRYLDLKEAESQAKEARIEASLERVRSRSMGMHSSDELREVVAVVYNELEKLGFDMRQCVISILNDEKKYVEWWSTGFREKILPKSFIIPFDNQYIRDFLKEFNSMVKQNIKYRDHVLSGEKKNRLDEALFEHTELKDLPEDAKGEMKSVEKIFLADAFMKYGMLEVVSINPISSDKAEIIQRFARIFEQTYTRFLDIQKAEEQTRIAERQASLDRVRGEIASMRKTEDLDRITPLIWKELTNLNINFFRCGVFIIEEDLHIVRVYLTTPSGKALAALHLPFESSDLVSQTYKYWQKQKVYKENWDRGQFIEWTKSLIENKFITDASEYRGGEAPPEILSLQFIPFKQGMLYIGSAVKLSEEEIETAKKLADSFGVAYARYEDFQKLEAANKRKTQELEEARELQLAMLPKNIPNLKDFELGVYMKTATEVGGDYYDFSFKHDGSVNIAIGDATGHGMKAGTMVTMIKSLFTANSSTEKITAFFSSSNEAIKNSNLKRMMVAFAMLNIYGKKLKVINAGMPPVYYYRSFNDEIYELGGNNLPLGGMHNVKYKADEIDMEKGDIILMLSDGLPELLNREEEMYGYDKIKEDLKSVAENNPKEIIDHLTASAEKWQNGRDADDDLTFVVIKVK